MQTALRLARAVTGRPKYLKFEGHYHGWDDSVLVNYHPTAEELRAAAGQPVPVGIGQHPHQTVVLAEWNDRAAVEKAFEAHGHEISALICEPLLCNSGCIPPADGFLSFLREITSATGSLLIFDEVITGFRLDLGGAQAFYGVTPDLATYAKALGGGAPLSALAGRREFMDWIADGKVLHAGTLNGNPLSLAAAAASLDTLARDDGALYRHLWRRGERLRTGIEQTLAAAGLRAVTSGGGPVFQVSFMPTIATNYRELLAANTALYGELALALLDEGILVLPDGHTDEDIEVTLRALERAVDGEARPLQA